MSKINLLPDSFKIKSSTVKISETLKKIYIISFVALVIIIATSVGLFYMYSVRIDEADSKRSSIRKQIKALEETEQRLILVQDRLEKVKQISKTKSTSEELDKLEFLIDSLGAVSIEQVAADTESIDIRITSSDTVETFEFVNLVKDSHDFSDVTIESMQFTPKSGFLTQLSLEVE